MYAATFKAITGRTRPGSKIGRVAHLILHHEYGRPLPATSTLAQEKQRLRAVDAYHLSLGWAGFGYSAMGCASGRVLEGRGYFRSGAHTGHMNRSALALLLPGTDTGMTDAQVDGIHAWQREGVRVGAIAPDAEWSGHRDHMDRDCPGDRNYSQLHRLRNPAPTPAPAPAPEEDDELTPEQDKMLREVHAALDAGNTMNAIRRTRLSIRAIGLWLHIPTSVNGKDDGTEVIT